MAQNTFKRVEIKYIISNEKYDLLIKALEPYLQVDEFGLSTIQSIYYDTEHYDIIRESLEKPVYKEKLRLRVYGDKVADDTRAYLELKKKYKDVVYKRRIHLPYKEAVDYMEKGIYPSKDSQILKEIDYFIKFHNPAKRTYVAYDRIAMYGKEDNNIRVTFDKNIRVRFDQAKLESVSDYKQIFENDERLMEIKVPGAIPLWLAGILSELEIYPHSFSKYGTACKKYLA